MTIAFLFWLLMILWFIFGAYRSWLPTGPSLSMGWDLVLFMLLFLLGWHAFGFPIRG